MILAAFCTPLFLIDIAFALSYREDCKTIPRFACLSGKQFDRKRDIRPLLLSLKGDTDDRYTGPDAE